MILIGFQIIFGLDYFLKLKQNIKVVFLNVLLKKPVTNQPVIFSSLLIKKDISLFKNLNYQIRVNKKNPLEKKL